MPFRQISAGRVEGSLEARFQAFLDRLVSRVVGATIRTFLIILGTLSLVAQSVLSLISLAAYPFLPVMPIFCLIMWSQGVIIL